MIWIDTHIHWDDEAFAFEQALYRRQQARDQGVKLTVVPSIGPHHFAAVQEWAHTQNDAYALGLHPFEAQRSPLQALFALEKHLAQCQDDPRLVAIGEVGLDAVVCPQKDSEQWKNQMMVFHQQIKWAEQLQLPLIIHARKSVEDIIRCLSAYSHLVGGIVHAFNGSFSQAHQLIKKGFFLGVGGAATYDRSHHLHQLLRDISASHWVLETDGPFMPPQWLYVTQKQRQEGLCQSIQGSEELPRIAQHIASIVAMPLQSLCDEYFQASLKALPRLSVLLSSF